MNKRKLKLKDIAGYLPYGLRVIANRRDALATFSIIDFEGQQKEIDERKVLTMGVDFDDKQIVDIGYCAHTPINKIKPLLRPLSDLYRPITHNGKEIVPIVELANMHERSAVWELFTDEYDITYAKSGECLFFYEWTKGGFSEYDESSSYGINNQYQLFDYLHELKIDCRGLIDAGLAIDVNMLEINPY